MIQVYHPSTKMAALFSNPLSWSWITVSGPDAKDFLHRLTTVHVKDLKINQGKPGCFLTPQGKIRAYFMLWNLAAGDYAFEFDAGSTGKWKKDFLALIDQYTFAEKMTIQDWTSETSRSVLDCRWIFLESEASLAELGSEFGTSLDPLQPGETRSRSGSIQVCHHGSLDYGRPWITVWGEPEALSQWMIQLNLTNPNLELSEIESWRIQAIRPRVDSEITETALPLEIGLRNAIADNKGCYPGQEVIEKIIALGSPPRRLARIHGEGITPPRPGDPILKMTEPPVEIGQITSVSILNSQYSALGLIKKIHAQEGLPVQFSVNPESKGVIIKVSSYD